MKQQITIFELPPMMNQLIRMNRWKYGELRDKWEWLIRAEKPAKHTGRVNIRLTRVSTRTPDPDNVAASFKFIGDALESLGVIADDSFNTIVDLTARWEKADSMDGQGVKIEIEDA